MKWVTRERVTVDGVACAWLIRKFIDPQAEFLFVPSDQVLEVAAREGATAFDEPGRAPEHADATSSFEALIEKHKLGEPPLDLLAEIVHGASVESGLSGRPESAGLKALATGFRYLGLQDDHEVLQGELTVYDALYAYCQQQCVGG